MLSYVKNTFSKSALYLLNIQWPLACANSWSVITDADDTSRCLLCQGPVRLIKSRHDGEGKNYTTGWNRSSILCRHFSEQRPELLETEVWIAKSGHIKTKQEIATGVNYLSSSSSSSTFVTTLLHASSLGFHQTKCTIIFRNWICQFVWIFTSILDKKKQAFQMDLSSHKKQRTWYMELICFIQTAKLGKLIPTRGLQGE